MECNIKFAVSQDHRLHLETHIINAIPENILEKLNQ